MPSSPSRRRFLGVVAAVGVGGLGSFSRSRPTTGRSASGTVTDEDRTRSPELAWSKTYGSSGNDEPIDLVPAHQGGSLALVAARGSESDVWLIASDANGEVEWQREYGFGSRDVPAGVRRVADGYVVAGWGREYENADKTPWLLRVAPDGRKRWFRRYGVPYRDQHVNALARSPGGGFVLGGTGTRYEADRQDVTWLLKTDADGRERWRRTYGDFAWLTGVARGRNGGYALVGHSHVPTAGGSRVYATLLGTDGEGREVWRRHYGGVEPERPQAVLSTPTGFVFAGEADSPADPGGLLVAVDHRGRAIWRGVYPGLGVVTGMVALSDGYALIGDRLARTDRRGRLLWSFDDFGFIDPKPKVLTRVQDGFVVGGSGGYTQNTGHQAWLAKIRIP